MNDDVSSNDKRTSCSLPWHMRLLAAASPGICELCTTGSPKTLSDNTKIVFEDESDNMMYCFRNFGVPYSVETTNEEKDKENMLHLKELGRENVNISPLVLVPMMQTAVSFFSSSASLSSNTTSSPYTTMGAESTGTKNSDSNNAGTGTIPRMMIMRPATKDLIQEYINYCSFFGCENRYNAGIITTIRYKLPCLRATGNFHDNDMLALCELLLRYQNAELKFIKRLDFSIASKEGRLYPDRNKSKGFKSHGALCLAKVLQQSKHIEAINCQRNKIGPFGSTALFLACCYNPTINTLVLRRCAVGERGALAFAEIISAISNTSNRNNNVNSNEKKGKGISEEEGKYQAQQKQQQGCCRLTEVDLSANAIGFQGCVTIENSLQEIRRTKSIEIFVDLEGNLVLQEVMNCVTHGLGILFAIVGGYLLMKRSLLDHNTCTQVGGEEVCFTDGSTDNIPSGPSRKTISCFIYSMSLLALYTCSTLYHSFFALQNTKYIFEVIDKCSIYILIAGSYTPFLQIVLGDDVRWCVYLLAFLWLCAISGMYIEASCPTWRYKSTFSLCMYVGMGWSVVICMPALTAIISQGAVNLIVLGGVGYTTAIPFFIRNNNFDHSIWHLFVLSGSIFHWCAIYFYVVRI